MYVCDECNKTMTSDILTCTTCNHKYCFNCAIIFICYSCNGFYCYKCKDSHINHRSNHL